MISYKYCSYVCVCCVCVCVCERERERERERDKQKIDKNKISMLIMHGSCHMIFMAMICRCFVL